MSEIETADDGGENARSVGTLTREVREIWSDKADGDFDGRVVNFCFEVVDQPGNDQADYDASNDEVNKALDPYFEIGDFSRDDESHSKFESEQAAGIVDEAF